MRLIRYPQYISLVGPTVVTIGNFDGVHMGHQALIKKVTAYANKNNLQSVVITMRPLASQYFGGINKTAILTPFKCKYHLIKKLGVDVLCALNFNKNLAEYTAEEFIDKILIKGLKAQHIIIGDDFKFGKNRAGNLQILKNQCEPLGVSVSAIATVANKSKRISSSQIRQSLSNNEFKVAELNLGRKFSIFGKVSKGQQLGRKLNFPTINIRLGKRFVPINGVFCVTVKFTADFDDREYLGSASIGTRPTVDGVANILEVYILDFNKQVYGRNVEVLFHHKLRNEVKFDSINELKRHINDDVIKTRLYFENNKH